MVHQLLYINEEIDYVSTLEAVQSSKLWTIQYYSNIVKENAKYTPNLAKPSAPSQVYICGTLCKSLTLNPCMYAYRETGWENKGMPHHGINKSIRVHLD